MAEQILRGELLAGVMDEVQRLVGEPAQLAEEREDGSFVRGLLVGQLERDIWRGASVSQNFGTPEMGAAGGWPPGWDMCVVCMGWSRAGGSRDGPSSV
ncbi:hypothetical protein E4U42_007715 [Claviceps africana]|uniref:Uncharacterized protein n=1 Tax=Claviceps africana TaxID=83212 RepID=A0A8K0NFZ0_9HYPO|nr:hypothetical protein E4U42_007715 [Claviceps africana]